MSIHQIIFFSLWFGACCYAALRGGAPERVAAAAQFGAVVLTVLFGQLRSSSYAAWSGIEVGIALTDLSLFLIIVAIAFVSTRFWPMLQASMLGCDLFGHLAKPLGPDIVPRAYYMTVAFWGYPTVILLAVATWRHRMRLKRYGVDYAWVWNLPRRYRDGWSVDELARPRPQS
jgi:hypothetical protein